MPTAFLKNKMLLNLTHTRQTFLHQTLLRWFSKFYNRLCCGFLVLTKKWMLTLNLCLPTALPQSQYHKGNFPAQPAQLPSSPGSPNWPWPLIWNHTCGDLIISLGTFWDFTRSLIGELAATDSAFWMWPDNNVETLCGTCFCTSRSLSY